jgi:outer membrane protein OmpA-like peptidoglycan-associated protein
MFYQIRETDVAGKEAVINKVAAWCRQNPGKPVSIKGYADKGTGTPAINLRYSRQRAQNVARALREKGVPDSQMQVSALGDKVQPFNSNDQNRCVIVVSE